MTCWSGCAACRLPASPEMRIERLDAEQVGRLGGPVAAAAHLRSLVPDGASVESSVRDIVEAVRTRGDDAVRDYTSRFDTSGNDPRPLVVSPGELDEAIKLLPLELVAGLQVAIANVAVVAQAGVSEDVAVELPQGQRITLREVPVASAAVYVPGGRAPYPSTVIMGVVTARAAGVLDVAVCSPPGVDGQIDPAILGVCRLCGVERVYRMGGAQAIAALAYGTETVDRVDVVVGPGNLFVQEAKRLLSATVGIDGFAGPSDLLVLLGTQAGEDEMRLAALDMLAQAEHGEGSLVVAVAPGTAVGDELASMLERLIVERPTVGEPAFGLVEVTGRTRGRRAGKRLRARAPGAHRPRDGGTGADGQFGRLPVRGKRERHRVRGLRRGQQPRPADRRCRAVRLDALGAPFPAQDGRGADWSGGRQAGGRGGADRARGGVRGSRRVDGGARGGECRTMSRTASIERRTNETDVRLTLTLDGTGAGTRDTGVGFLDHMLDLLARHGRLDLDVKASGDLETGAHHTVEDTAIVLGQALDTALGDRAGIVRYGSATAPMDEARASCAIDISGRPFTLFEAELPSGSTGGFDHELTEEFFRALVNAAKLTVHLRVEAGTNAHHMIEAAFKAFARALRQAVEIDPTETGVPSTKGTLTG